MPLAARATLRDRNRSQHMLASKGPLETTTPYMELGLVVNLRTHGMYTWTHKRCTVHAQESSRVGNRQPCPAHPTLPMRQLRATLSPARCSAGPVAGVVASLRQNNGASGVQTSRTRGTARAPRTAEAEHPPRQSAARVCGRGGVPRQETARRGPQAARGTGRWPQSLLANVTFALLARNISAAPTTISSTICFAGRTSEERAPYPKQWWVSKSATSAVRSSAAQRRWAACGRGACDGLPRPSADAPPALLRRAKRPSPGRALRKMHNRCAHRLGGKPRHHEQTLKRDARPPISRSASPIATS